MRYDEAIPHYIEVIRIYKCIFGEYHEWVATALNNLAMAYRAKGKNKEAIELYEEVLDIDKKTIGDIHPNYAIHLNNLANVYQMQGKYDESVLLLMLRKK
jgi:tetratricopeptide (TPR) repeat protein